MSWLSDFWNFILFLISGEADYAAAWDALESTRYLSLGLGGAALLAFLWFVILRLRQPKFFAARNDRVGKVYVLRSAIRDMVRRTCEADFDIVKSKVKIKARARRLRVGLTLRLRASARINEVSERIQQKIETVLHRNLGVENQKSIDVIVTGFTGKTPADYGDEKEHPAPAPVAAAPVAAAAVATPPPPPPPASEPEPVAEPEPEDRALQENEETPVKSVEPVEDDSDRPVPDSDEEEKIRKEG